MNVRRLAVINDPSKCHSLINSCAQVLGNNVLNGIQNMLGYFAWILVLVQLYAAFIEGTMPKISTHTAHLPRRNLQRRGCSVVANLRVLCED